MRKITTFLSLMLASAFATAASIPSTTSLPNGYDRVKGSSGITCESTVAPKAYMDFGIVGSDYDSSEYNPYYTRSGYDRNDEVMAYAKVVVPIGGNTERVNCNRLYDLELEKLRAELDYYKIQAQAPKSVTHDVFIK